MIVPLIVFLMISLSQCGHSSNTYGSLRILLTTDAAIALANTSQSSDPSSLQSAYRDMPLITIHSALRSCEAAKTPIERPGRI